VRRTIQTVDFSQRPGGLQVVVFEHRQGAETPVGSAELHLSGPSSDSNTTAADGARAFTTLIPGTYTVVAHKDGFFDRMVDVTLAPGASPDLRIELVPKELRIVVRADVPAGTLVPGATVRITPSGRAAQSQVTRADGTARFPNVDPGQVSVHVERRHYTTRDLQVTMSQSQTEFEVRIRPQVTLEFLDAAGAVASFVRIGLWDHAFSGPISGTVPASPNPPAASTGPSNGQPEAANFVGSDTRRFSLRVVDPLATGGQLEIDWWVAFGNGADFTDTPADKRLTLQETAAGSEVFTSRGVMLVSDHEDTLENTHSGLLAGPDAEPRPTGSRNHRLRRTDMFSSVKARYSPAGRPVVEPAPVPVFRRTPNERRNMPIVIFVLRVAPGAGGVVPTAPGSQVWADLRKIREMYGRLGIWVWTDVPASAPTSTAVADGADRLFLVDAPAGVNPVNVTSANETTLANTYTAPANTIRLFYVGGGINGNRGESFPPFFGDARVGACFVNRIPPTYTTPHEMGHVLTNKHTNTNGGHYMPPGPANLGAYPNLMRNGTSNVIGARESKRLWQVADGDGINQVQLITATSNAFTRAS